MEKEVNDIVSGDHEVTFYKLPREKAAKITDLNLVPDSISEVGIYEIAGFNKLACVGPHVKNTKEVGEFNILKIKKSGKGCYSIKFTVI